MKLNQTEVKIITGATAVDLETAINAWLQQKTEKQLVGMQFTDGTNGYTCYITFTK